MFSMFSSRGKEKLALVFDVGSSSVGGALFYMSNSGVPKVIFSVRESIILSDKVSPERFLTLTLKSLEIIVSKIHKSGIGAPKQIFCVLGSPWYLSQTRVIKLKKDEPFVFTSNLANELIKKEVSSFEEEFFTKYMHSDSPIRSIELKNIKTTLNGYETSAPLDQKVKDLEMTLFISMSAEEVLKKIEAMIGNYFFGDIKFSSFAMASFAVVREMHAHQENFLLIDIGGEMTDILMVKNNALRESISFPMGSNLMVRGIASVLNCSLSDAKSCMSLFKDGHASVSTRKKLESIIEKLKTDWLAKFQESLANLSSDISIPSNIYLSVQEDLADFFSKIIENEQFSQYTLAESQFKITFLDPLFFRDLASFKYDITRDSNIIVDTIYINKFLTNHILVK